MKKALLCLIVFLPLFSYGQGRSEITKRIEALELKVFGGCEPVTVFLPAKRAITQIVMKPCKRGTPAVKIKRPIFRAKAVIIYPPISPGGNQQAVKVKVGKKWLEETYAEPVSLIVKKIGKK